MSLTFAQFGGEFWPNSDRFQPVRIRPLFHVRVSQNHYVVTFTAVVTTGIYCRPGCGVRANPKNFYEFASAAAAEAAGYRACRSCRPYRLQPSLGWAAPELICRAVRLILQGALRDESENELAASLGVSARHLRRLFGVHLGVTPDQLARSAHAHFARRLLDDTDFSIGEISFAAGFGSVRQFNRVCAAVFQATPRELRARRRKNDRLVADGGLLLRLPFEAPLDWGPLLNYFAARAVPGVENVVDSTYLRTVVIDGNPGVLELSPGGKDHLLLRAHLPRWEGLIHIAQRARQIFNLDADVTGAFRHLSRDPILKPLLQARPGLRPPGTWDAFETGVRAILGQQLIDESGTLIARVVARHGRSIPGLRSLGLSHLFPSASTLASADFRGLGVSNARAATVRAFAEAVDVGTINMNGACTLDELIRSLLSIPGLDTSTAHYIAFRLGEPDAFPRTGLNERPTTRVPQGRQIGHVLTQLAAHGRPWRAHAVALLCLTAESARRRAPSSVA